MKKHCLNNLRNNKGVTFVETVISLFILSIVMIILFRLGSTLIPSLLEDRVNILELRRDTITYRSIQQEIDNIEAPWWLSEYAITSENNRWEFPWYLGNEDDKLIIELIDNSLVIGDGETNHILINNCNNFELNQIYDKNGSLYLLKITFNDKENYYPINHRITIGKEIE